MALSKEQALLADTYAARLIVLRKEFIDLLEKQDNERKAGIAARETSEGFSILHIKAKWIREDAKAAGIVTRSINDRIRKATDSKVLYI